MRSARLMLSWPINSRKPWGRRESGAVLGRATLLRRFNDGSLTRAARLAQTRAESVRALAAILPLGETPNRRVFREWLFQTHPISLTKERFGFIGSDWIFAKGCGTSSRTGRKTLNRRLSKRLRKVKCCILMPF